MRGVLGDGDGGTASSACGRLGIGRRGASGLPVFARRVGRTPYIPLGLLGLPFVPG